MANVTSAFSGSIASMDVNNKQVIRDIGSPQLAGDVGDLVTYRKVAQAPADTEIVQASAKAYCVYVKNLGATPIKIKGTPSGGAEAILCAALPQNGVLIVWNTVNNVADVGYTSIKLSCGVVDNPVEYYIGG